MKLPRLSPDEIRALQIHSGEAGWNLAERIKAHLMAGLPPHVRVEIGMLSLPVSIFEADPPRLRADDDLLAAWVAVRFGSDGVCKPVPLHYAASLLARIGQALAEVMLRGQLDEASSLNLEIRMNDQPGRLELDWSDMSANALRKWALQQWECAHE
jgi:hypothetical protein